MKNIQQRDLSKGFFLESLEKVIFDVPSRSQEIIRSRYGIAADYPKTLEEIGKDYNITRERVRQIIKEVFKKIKLKEEENYFRQMSRKIEVTINQNNGIIKEKDVLYKLAGGNPKEQNAVRFLLECLENIVSREIENELEKSYHTRNFDFSEWQEIKNTAKEILEMEKEVIVGEDFYGRFSKKVDSADRKKFFNFINISKEIEKNSFGKWGLSHWGDVNPRVAWQRAYVILKEIGKPLHFKEIARFIDKYELSKKKTHPQTIHNELIKNDQFVLVGRGVYALSKWGYKKGTVKDVLEDILKENEKPMERDEILDRISKIRQVKKSTILINLNNFFEKVEKDKYTVRN